MLKSPKFKPYVLFGRHPLLDKLLRILQRPPHVSKLTAKKY